MNAPTVPTVPSRSFCTSGTRSFQRSHRSHTLKGGNVGTVTLASDAEALGDLSHRAGARGVRGNSKQCCNPWARCASTATGGRLVTPLIKETRDV
jgi:hypothetical protein